MARKAEFKKRVEVTVYLEEWERKALSERLRDTAVTASGLLRHLLQCYLESDATTHAPDQSIVPRPSREADDAVGTPASVIGHRLIVEHDLRCPCVICTKARAK